MKNVLLPTDFSDNALNAIFTAIKLQHNTPCNFVLLHTYEPDNRNKIVFQTPTRTGTIYESMHEHALKNLEITLDAIAKVSDCSQHTFSMVAKSGNLVTIINELIPKHDLDLIVMGTKGASSTAQILLGSNTVRVLKKNMKCPILVIPEKYNFQSLAKIIFPTEFSNFFSKTQLTALTKLAGLWRSQVLVFHVAQEFKLSEQQKANKQILKERLENISYSFHNVPIHTTVSETIREFANEQGANLICLVQYSHSFMEKLTQEPVVKKVGFHTEIPLLVLPE